MFVKSVIIYMRCTKLSLINTISYELDDKSKMKSVNATLQKYRNWSTQADTNLNARENN